MIVVRTRSGQMFLAEQLGQDSIFPDKVAFKGVQGVTEGSIPGFTVKSMNMDKADVLYVLDGVVEGTEPPKVPDKVKLTLVPGGNE